MHQYKDLLAKIVLTGTVKTDRTGTGTTSIFGPQMRFDLREGFPLVTTKKVYMKGIIHELLWFLKGDTNIKYLMENGVNIWNDWIFYDQYCKAQKLYPNVWPELTKEELLDKIKTDRLFQHWGDLGPIYGAQWCRWETDFGVDGLANSEINQIQQMVDLLRNSPDSRRMVVSAWNVSDLPKMGLTPCHCLFQFYTVPLTFEERKRHYFKHLWHGSGPDTPADEAYLDSIDTPRYRLDCQLYQRSADVFLGVPFNIASYALLTMMVAQVVNMQAGEFIWTGGDTHIYSNHMEQVQTQLKREERDLPTMEINPAVKDIFSFKFEDFNLVGYNPHPAIKAPVAV